MMASNKPGCVYNLEFLRWVDREELTKKPIGERHKTKVWQPGKRPAFFENKEGVTI